MGACKVLTHQHLVVNMADVISVEPGRHGGWDVHVWSLHGQAHVVSTHRTADEANDQADGLRKTLRTWLA